MKSSYHVEFRRIPRQSKFTFFEACRRVRDTWHFVSGSRGATCQAVGKSNIELKWGSRGTHGIMSLEENLKVVG